MVTHPMKGLPWVRVSEIINISNINIIVGETKVVKPLSKSDVKVLVKETESDPLLLISI
jgi:hypothetical protein